ncbi:DUF92 domain-containing protein [Niabella terrae]
MSWNEWMLLILTLAAAVAACGLGKLSPAGALMGFLIAGGIYLGAGAAGLVLLAAFFACGVLATAWKWQDKQNRGLAEGPTGRRHAGQVLANGGLAGALGLIATLLPPPGIDAPLWIGGALAAACSDSLSSELGNIYGRKFLDLRNLRKGQRGANGVVSIEGSLAGLAGSLLIAGLYSAFYGWTAHFWIIGLAGCLGNLTDSLLGAFWERKGLMGNNLVNFSCTAIGALTAAVLGALSG